MDVDSLSDEKSHLAIDEVRKLVKYKLEKKIAQLPYGFWRCKNGKLHSKIAIRYLIEEHLGIEIKEIPKKVSAKTFHDSGLFRILVEFFDSSYYKAIDFAYPNMFKPWEFPKGMTGIWDGDKGRQRSLEAIQYIIEELDIPESEIPKKINYKTFKEFGLGGMLQTLYNSSPYQALNALYPGKFKPWEFSVKNFWKNQTQEVARQATMWLIKEKLQYSLDEINKIKRKDFLENKLGQLLKEFYNNSHIKALEDILDIEK